MTVGDIVGGVSLRDIWGCVSQVTGVVYNEVCGRGRRTVRITHAKRLFVLMARELRHDSYPEIATFLGRKHHSTVHTAHMTAIELDMGNTQEARDVREWYEIAHGIATTQPVPGDLCGRVTKDGIRNAVEVRRKRRHRISYDVARERDATLPQLDNDMADAYVRAWMRGDTVRMVRIVGHRREIDEAVAKAAEEANMVRDDRIAYQRVQRARRLEKWGTTP